QFWSSNGEGDVEFGVFQSTLELKALVQEITGNTGSTVPYKDFTMVMLGRRSTMCQRYPRISLCYQGKTTYSD
uniref:Uncharacterized protein n=1 Tax=Terrapene triunguis TaxID=2587831 RepID=A0A674IRQ9_9SAUR